MNGDIVRDSGIITNKLRDYIWYFSFSSCEIPFSDLYNSNHKIVVEMTLMNDGSHFSMEEGNMVWSYIILFGCIVFF